MKRLMLIFLTALAVSMCCKGQRNVFLITDGAAIDGLHAPWDGLDDDTRFRCFTDQDCFYFFFEVNEPTLTLTLPFTGERDVDPEDRELTVNFDGRSVCYDSTELDELVLAYAVTIHKSQGSEYPIVVIPILTTHYVMLQRNLLYTGVTRAKKVLVLVGTKKALSIAVRNSSVRRRNTLLCERIRLAFSPSKTK